MVAPSVGPRKLNSVPMKDGTEGGIPSSRGCIGCAPGDESEA